MISSNVNTYSFIYRFIDLVALFASLAIVLAIAGLILGHDYVIASLITSVIFLYLAECFSLYRAWNADSLFQMIVSTWACIILTFFVHFLLVHFIQELSYLSFDIIILWLTLTLLLSLSWRVLQFIYIRLSHKAGFHIKRVAVIGATESAQRLLMEIDEREELGYLLQGVFDDREPQRIGDRLQINVDGKIEQAIQLAYAGKIDLLFIALPLKAEKRVSDILIRLADTTIDVHYIPDRLISTLVRSRCINVGDLNILSVFESPYLGTRRWVKRCEDIIISSFILCLISVLLVLISFCVRLTSKGPILFKQHRYGLNGETILVWKFRTMRVIEDSNHVQQATRHDPRVTRLGGFLRRTSLDELPQFFNVLMGDMSVVGPRPHAVVHNEQYRNQVSYYMLRHKVKPGITGLAQVNGLRGETDTLEKMENRVKLDLQYMKNWSLGLDIKIILLTIVKAFTDKNVY